MKLSWKKLLIYAACALLFIAGYTALMCWCEWMDAGKLADNAVQVHAFRGTVVCMVAAALIVAARHIGAVCWAGREK